MNKYLALAFAISMVFFLAFKINPAVQDNTTSFVASVFFQKSIDTDNLIKKFESAAAGKKLFKKDNVKILIIPGHDDINSGAIAGSVKEAELNLFVAKELNNLLKKEKGIETFLTRDF